MNQLSPVNGSRSEVNAERGDCRNQVSSRPSPIVCALSAMLLGLGLPVGDLLASERLPMSLARNAYEATVRIELHKKDSMNRSVGPPDVGHGVYVDPSGLILTALHVAVPSRASTRTAVSYQLKVRHWDSSESRWVDGFTISASDLRDSLISGSPIEECQVNEHFSPIPCISDPPGRETDYAMFRNPNGSGLAFVDVIGPFDEISRTALASTNWATFALSDFYLNGVLEEAELSPISYRDAFIFSTESNRLFEKGISGSPVFIYLPDGEPELFLVGLAVEQLQPPHYRVNLVLVQEFLKNHVSDLLGRISQESVGDCRSDSMPYNFSLIGNLMVRENRPLDIDEKRALSGCMEKHLPWRQTKAIVEFTNQNLLQLNRAFVRASSDFFMLGDGVDSSTGKPQVLDSSLSARRARSRVAEVLLDAYGQGIDPVDVLTAGVPRWYREADVAVGERAAEALAQSILDIRTHGIDWEKFQLLNSLGIGELIISNEFDADGGLSIAFEENPISDIEGVS
jgi:hypothetical protein